MNIDNIEELKEKFADFKQMFSADRIDDATALIEELLESIERQSSVRKAGTIDNRGHIDISQKHMQPYVQKMETDHLEGDKVNVEHRSEEHTSELQSLA